VPCPVGLTSMYPCAIHHPVHRIISLNLSRTAAKACHTHCMRRIFRRSIAMSTLSHASCAALLACRIMSLAHRDMSGETTSTGAAQLIGNTSPSRRQSEAQQVSGTMSQCDFNREHRVPPRAKSEYYCRILVCTNSHMVLCSLTMAIGTQTWCQEGQRYICPCRVGGDILPLIACIQVQVVLIVLISDGVDINDINNIILCCPCRCALLRRLQLTPRL
jgi:hypothetical protein